MNYQKSLSRPARSVVVRNTERFTLSLPQSKIWKAVQKYRFIAICAGRRGGKTEISKKLLIARACSESGQLCWYIAPTYRMSKRLLWENLKKDIPRELILNKNESELRIELINESVIQLFGADNPDGLVGAGVDFCIVDEAALMRNLEKLIDIVLRPALADRQGQLILATTPRGYNYFFDLCCRCWNFPYPRTDSIIPSTDWWFYTYTTIEGGNVTPSELAELAATMPLKIFRQESEARFETPSGQVYENYHTEANRLDDADRQRHLNDRADLWIGIDFNVNPMTFVVSVRDGRELHVIDAVEIPDSNTQILADEIKAKYPGHRLVAFPDPSGKARKTSASAGITDFTILSRAGFEIVAPAKAPPIRDRVNLVNALLCDANGDRKLLIHPKAKPLIKAFNGLCYKENTSVIDKDSGLDHVTDCIGYIAWSGFNILAAKIPANGGRVY